MNEPKTSIRVLAVDDHELLRDGIRLSLLKEVDIELVAEARSGEDALQKCDQLIPDVVLMDMEMPVMGGVEASKKILSSLNERAPKIIAITANALRDSREECLAAGMSDFITKPIFREALQAAISRAL